MWERFVFWFMGYGNCAGCCLGCSYFDECKAKVYEYEDEYEDDEREVIIDNIIRKRLPEHHKKSA